ncbi:hypothetical protein [Sphingomonas sp. M1-B02]|uniref:hypothetical protein n=1 Tax=Sphingomonas sp. M1-B02 TaxID=3114300 RepID=UPI00224089D1|nr:hypothetical protein [Sphingomonas sp. S6-11]UZK67438.1 hypothetical protein OKW87_06290 [Sphingomonas sp. S6-11]
MGATFSGYVRVNSDSVSDKESIAASMSASINGLVTHGSIDATWSSDVNSAQVSKTTEMGYVATGMDPVTVTGDFNVSSLENTVSSLAPASSGIAGVTGKPIAVVCVTWDQVGQIQATCSQTVLQKLQLVDLQSTLDRLSLEYAQLSYVVATANRLAGSGAVVNAYVPLLHQLANYAQDRLARIAGLRIRDIRWLAANAGSVDWYEISPLLLPMLGWVGRGQAHVQVWYSLDWAFGSPTDNQIVTVTPSANPAEVQLGHWVHARPEGDDPPQTMDLYYRVFSNSGTPTITTRMNWYDPWGPGSGQFDGNVVQMLAGANLTSVAAWTPWNNNRMSVAVVDTAYSLPPGKQ